MNENTHTTSEHREGWESGWITHGHGPQSAGSFSGPWFTAKKRWGELGGEVSIAWNMNVLE